MPSRVALRSLQHSALKRMTHARRSIFTYHVAASAAAKRTAVNKPEADVNHWTQPRTNAASDPFFCSTDRCSGEDAFFLSRPSTTTSGQVVLGLADGVGGWRDAGIDPGPFSHGLCRYMAQESQQPDQTPKALLTKAFDRVLRDTSIQAGGSTATIAKLSPDGRMEAANLGDSGYAIFEPNKVVTQSTPQTQGFNTPFQLTKLTPRMRAQQQIFGDGASADYTPADAHVAAHSLRHGNVVVLATDGLWDNLDSMDVLRLVAGVMDGAGWAVKPGSASSPTDDEVAARVAFAIMRRAKLASLDPKRDGPFAREAKRYYPREPFQGGKVDDITVLVAIVAEQATLGREKAKL